MTELLTFIKWIFGGTVALGALGVIVYTYFQGKQDQKNKQKLKEAEEVKKDAEIDAEPDPTGNDIRDSLRDGEF